MRSPQTPRQQTNGRPGHPQRPLTGPLSHPFLRETSALEDRILAAGASNGTRVQERGLAELAARFGPRFADVVQFALTLRGESRVRCRQCKGSRWVNPAGRRAFFGSKNVIPCPTCRPNGAERKKYPKPSRSKRLHIQLPTSANVEAAVKQLVGDVAAELFQMTPGTAELMRRLLMASPWGVRPGRVSTDLTSTTNEALYSRLHRRGLPSFQEVATHARIALVARIVGQFPQAHLAALCRAFRLCPDTLRKAINRLSGVHFATWRAHANYAHELERLRALLRRPQWGEFGLTTPGKQAVA